jgi:hypothetical protein
MNHQLRSRTLCMDTIRKYVDVDPWFASYALEQLCVQSDLRVLNELAEGLVGLVENPAATGNDRVVKLVRERFGV